MPTKYNCLTCGNELPVDMTKDELLKHLTETHEYKVGTPGKRTAKMFLDGANGWHQQVYELDFGTFKVTETWTSK